VYFYVFSLGYCEFSRQSNAVDCLKWLISEMAYYAFSGTLNFAHALTVVLTHSDVAFAC